MKEPTQWSIKQHLEKYPKCEWICMHTNLKNLGESEEGITELQSNTKGDKDE